MRGAGLIVGSGDIRLFAVCLVAAGAAGAAVPCRYGPPRQVATVRDERLDECSGLAASRRNPGILWAHNDSGDGARLYALDMEGRTRAVVSVEGARAVDWEDIAAGPGPDGRPSLFIGDIGNNAHAREDLVVYCIPEPDLSGAGPEVRSEPARALPFRYPDGRFDAEALMAHPRTGALTIITKRAEETTGIYRFPKPLRPGERVTLERLGTLRLPVPSIWGRMVTAADIAPGGERCVLRTYLSIMEFRVAPGRRLEDALAGEPAEVPAPPELQGEAIAYRADGEGLVTLGEGRRPRLYLIPCVDPASE
ncbi:MAG: hypothetical protein HY321_19470 [Armatimonadetes bacterium]|nr:hypothetical protein [Armatimonadota bacterium]